MKIDTGEFFRKLGLVTYYFSLYFKTERYKNKNNYDNIDLL